MDAPLANLVAASVAFVGTHFALSHPLRAPLVKMLGERGFLALYSVVALVTFGWMIVAFRLVGPGGTPLWNGTGDIAWVVASVLTLCALVLLFGSLIGNPALPAAAKSAGLATKQPTGVFRVTRHPMMWAFALWAIAHGIVSSTPRSLIVSAAILILALVGAHLQDRKKAALLGADWNAWSARTRYWPRWAALFNVGWGLWALATVGWLAFTWAHIHANGMTAGLWRWAA